MKIAKKIILPLTITTNLKFAKRRISSARNCCTSFLSPKNKMFVGFWILKLTKMPVGMGRSVLISKGLQGKR